MDDRKEALTDLRAKIEAGEAEDWITYALAIGLRPDDRHIHAWNAYNGSLDAAKALHEAVLPEPVPEWIYGDARSELVRIIKALIAKADA